MITVYGADWCEDTSRARRLLRRLGVRSVYRNVDFDAAALERAQALNDGKRRTPTIDLGGEVLVEPSNESLADALVRHGALTDEERRERTQVQNVGDLERIVRAAAGALAVGMAVRRRGLIPLAGLGAIWLLTGVTGWCPAYAATHVTSLGGPGDRPAEAERKTWLLHV